MRRSVTRQDKRAWFTDSSSHPRTYRQVVGAPEVIPDLLELFMAERYLPASTPETLAAEVERDRAAARAMAIRHLQAIYVPADETCFSLYEAPSAEFVTEASDRFALGYRRVLPAISISCQADETGDEAKPDRSRRRDLSRRSFWGA